MERRVLFALLILFGLACQNQPEGGQDTVVEEITPSGSLDPAAIVRTPVSASEPQDTVNVARMHFEEPRFDFGTVVEGETVEHAYSFVNDGQVPLLISSARSTCGCTVPEWPRQPIPPGDSGSIIVRFNTQHRVGPQTKPVTILANTYPSVNQVLLQGIVRSAPSANQQ